MLKVQCKPTRLEPVWSYTADHILPLSSVLIYNGSTVLHFLLGGIGIALGYSFSSWAGYSFGAAYLVLAFAEMYVLMPLLRC